MYPFGVALVQGDVHGETPAANRIEEAGRFSGIEATPRVDHPREILRGLEFDGHPFGAAPQPHAIVALGGCAYPRVLGQILLPDLFCNSDQIDQF